MPDQIPSHARVVVIGGGVVGASVAYHLAKLGCADTLLLERAKIGSGTTWHAAGNMETYRADPLIGEMVAYAVDLYPRLEAETGQALGWRQTGRVMYATSPARLAQYRGLPALGRARGIDFELLTPRGVVERLPIASEAGLAGGVWIPNDGRINPTDLATAFARGARQRGARVVEDAPVSAIRLENGRIRAVVTPLGEVVCETVVIAAGLWSTRLAAMVGTAIPLHAAQHLYLLTKPIDGLSRDLPLFMSHDEMLYGREDVGGLLVGFFDRNAIPITADDLPADFSFGLLDGNWDQVEANVTVALERFPALRSAEIRTLLNGPESFTPDMQMLLGELPSVPGCFLAAGMNSSGIALSAAAGRLTAEWIVEGQPSLDATRLDIRRFAPFQSQGGYLRRRTGEVVAHMCASASPSLDFAETRMIRRSPLHAALAAQGAQFVSVLGWERPAWFAAGGAPAEDWAAHVAAEIAASESGVALFDRSSDVKLRLDGPKAEALLRRLCGAVAALPVGGVVCGPLLNARGGVEAIAGIVRLAADSWLLLAEPEQASWLTAWVERHRPGAGTSIVDVSGGWAALELVGPNAAPLLATLGCGASADAAALGRFELGHAPAMLVPWRGRAVRYVMLPAEFAGAAYEVLVAAGAALGLRHAGSLAAEAVALRHGERRFGFEASPHLSVVASGADGALDVDGNRGFIGRGAVLRHRKRRPRRTIRAFMLGGVGTMRFADAPVMIGDRLAGHVTSGAFLPALGKAVLLALVDQDSKGTGYTLVLDGAVHALTPHESPV